MRLRKQTPADYQQRFVYNVLEEARATPAVSELWSREMVSRHHVTNLR